MGEKGGRGGGEYLFDRIGMLFTRLINGELMHRCNFRNNNFQSLNMTPVFIPFDLYRNTDACNLNNHDHALLLPFVIIRIIFG